MAILDRNAILGAQLKTRTVTIPELGGDVRVRELRGSERSEIEILSLNIRDNKELLKQVRPLIASMCLVDENGINLFTREDIDELNKLSASALDKINDAVETLIVSTESEIKKAAKK